MIWDDRALRDCPTRREDFAIAYRVWTVPEPGIGCSYSRKGSGPSSYPETCEWDVCTVCRSLHSSRGEQSARGYAWIGSTVQLSMPGRSKVWQTSTAGGRLSLE